jgi:hypothetical protein
MIACKECGEELSAKADKCPRCGIVLRKKLTYGGLVSRRKFGSVDSLAYRFLMIVLIIALIAWACYVARKFM